MLRFGRVPFVPELIGSHWAQAVQLDVVALNWRERALLLGECTWGVDAVGRSVVRELVEEKTPKWGMGLSQLLESAMEDLAND